MKLSKSLEDYLETIYNLSSKDKNGVLSKDIAEYMQVTLPSVNTAVKNLSEKDFLEHKPYEAVKLTKKGEKKAKDIVKRHLTIRAFLIDVLELDYESAEKEACNLEHAIEVETSDKLAGLMERLKSDHHFDKLFNQKKSSLTLRDMKPGESGTVLSVNGELLDKHRLVEMGIIPGTKVKVIRKAPLGDPIEVKTRGFLLSMRLSEAQKVIVKLG